MNNKTEYNKKCSAHRLPDISSREEQPTPAYATCTPRTRKYIPETQRLIACACNNTLSIGTHSQVQYSQRVPCEGGQLLHGGVPPHDDLIETVAMSRDDLVDVLGPNEVTHLGSGVDAMQRHA